MSSLASLASPADSFMSATSDPGYIHPNNPKFVLVLLERDKSTLILNDLLWMRRRNIFNG